MKTARARVEGLLAALRGVDVSTLQSQLQEDLEGSEDDEEPVVPQEREAPVQVAKKKPSAAAKKKAPAAAKAKKASKKKEKAPAKKKESQPPGPGANADAICLLFPGHEEGAVVQGGGAVDKEGQAQEEAGGEQEEKKKERVPVGTPVWVWDVPTGKRGPEWCGGGVSEVQTGVAAAEKKSGELWANVEFPGENSCTLYPNWALETALPTEREHPPRALRSPHCTHSPLFAPAAPVYYQAADTEAARQMQQELEATPPVVPVEAVGGGQAGPASIVVAPLAQSEEERLVALAATLKEAKEAKAAMELQRKEELPPAPLQHAVWVQHDVFSSRTSLPSNSLFSSLAGISCRTSGVGGRGVRGLPGLGRPHVWETLPHPR